MQEIRKALETRLLTVAGITLTDVAWDNFKFDPASRLNASDPANSTPFYRCSLRPLSSRRTTLDTGMLNRGLLLVDVFYPEGFGASLAEAKADAIIDKFQPEDILTENSKQIRVRYSERAGGIVDAPWFMIPITISWYSFY